MVMISGSTINYYPLHKTSTQPSSVYDTLQDKLTIIKRFFLEANVDVTNNPEAYSLQESLKHTLICSAEAENIGVPTTVIIDNFKGLFVEFTRSERTHPQKSVSITLLSLKCPLVLITASIEDSLYSEKIINLLEEERQAIRKRYRTEVESMHYAALRALERKKTALTSIRKDKSIEGWREYIRHEFHHFDMEVRANNLNSCA